MSLENNLQQNKKFFDRVAKSYDQKLVQFWMKKFQKPILKIRFSKDDKLLDVSCGTGELLLTLSKNKNLQEKNFFGIDFSEEMLKKARARISPKINLQQTDVHNLPFQNNSFDYVISTEAFHHYYNQEKALAELVRVTKLGGKVIIVDINFFLKPIHYLFQKLEPGCVKINSKREIKQLFQKVGLHNIQQERSFLFAILTTGIKRN